MSKKNNRFQGGKAGTTYTCGSCGKVTRETGEEESSCGLCAYCYLSIGYENSFVDGHISESEFNSLIATLNKKYHRDGSEVSK